MVGLTLKKSCNVIVLPEGNGAYRLYVRGTGQSVLLDPDQAQAWFEGDFARLGMALDEVRKIGAVQESSDTPFIPHELDNLIPAVSERWLRYYSESPDLTVLFNTRSMREKNPLLVLGPYGSGIWNGIVGGTSIGEIRRRVRCMFGADEVLPFLGRLMNLGFLVPLEQISGREWGEQKVIKEFVAPEVQFMLKHSSLPWYCLWEISTLCDTRCQICYLNEYQNPGPQDGELDEIIKQIDKAGIFYVTLLGGEALLRRDLEEIIARLRSSNIFVKLITNGHLLTPERAASLARANVNHVEVSFDGLTVDSHEGSRVRGSFGKAEQALKTAQDCGIPRVSMVLTLYSQNFDDLPDLPFFMKEHELQECYISLFRKTGLMGGRSSITPVSPGQLSEALLMIGKWRIDHPGLTVALLPACTCGRTSVVIGADDTLRPCPSSYDSSMGNLLDGSLIDLWTRIGEQARAGVFWCQVRE